MTVSFLIVRLPKKDDASFGKNWNYIKTYISHDGLKSCGKIQSYSDLLFDDEIDEYIKRMNCDVITEEQFDRDYWKNDFSTKKRGDYRRYDSLNEKLKDAINICEHCNHKDCFRGCKTYKVLCKYGA